MFYNEHTTPYFECIFIGFDILSISILALLKRRMMLCKLIRIIWLYVDPFSWAAYVTRMDISVGKVKGYIEDAMKTYTLLSTILQKVRFFAEIYFLWGGNQWLFYIDDKTCVSNNVLNEPCFERCTSTERKITAQQI